MDAHIKNVVLGIAPGGSAGSTSIVDLSPKGRAIINSGVVVADLATSQYSGPALRFDGAAELVVPSSPDFDLGNYYTVECGFMTDSIYNWFGLFHRGYYSNYSNEWNGLTFSVRHVGDGYLMAYFWGTSYWNQQLIVSNVQIQANRHYHLALVRNGSTAYLMLDGAIVGSVSGLNVCAASGTDLRIGHFNDPSRSDGHLTGYMDNVRITKHVPRWTSAFTPQFPLDFTLPSPSAVTSNALRLGALDAGYFLRTVTTPGDGKKLTVSARVAVDTLGMESFFYGSRSSQSSYDVTAISVRGALFSVLSRTASLEILVDLALATPGSLDMPAGADRHLVVTFDTTQPIDSDRVRLYLNGARVSLSGTFPPQNAVLPLLQAGQIEYIGANWGNPEYAHGLLGGLVVLDGVAATPAQFNGPYGAYTAGSYGVNGCFLAFQDTSGETVNTNSGFGADSSGLGNFRPSYGITITNAVTMLSLPAPLSVSGVVRDASGAFAARAIFVHRNDFGDLLGSTTSNSSTGAYSVPLTYSGAVDITAKDSTGLLPDLILSRVIPG